MPQVRATISLNHGGQEIGGAGAAPLRFAYVRHEPFGPTYITDVNGRIHDKDGNEGISSLTTSADITVHCQNSVARVLDSNDLLQRCPTMSATITSRGAARDTVTILGTNPNIRHFRILNQVAACYHLVWRQFEPFASREEFPLGRSSNDLETTRNQAKRIEILFPSPASALPGIATALGITLPPTMSRVLSFTDPVGTADGWPRINVEPDPPESRLFTGGAVFANGNRSGLQLIPSELPHSLHFSLLTKSKRDQVRTDYLGFMIGQLINGLPATHAIGAVTSPMVAFIESLDHLSHRLSEHMRSTRQTFPANVPDFGRYVVNEMRGRNPVAPRVARLAIDSSGGRRRIVARPATGLTLSGSNDEGAVLGALFIDLAFRIGLKSVVEAVFESKRLTFGQFRTWFNNNRSAESSELDAAATTWGF